ncbi:MAG: 50S ribosomal protein L35 [Holosporaceae bacterium]|nr:50S ribosomal protein L35 [Holosporaceae bacterium]
MKLKTKSSAKKRFSFTSAGHIKCGSAYLRHNLRKRSQKMKRQARGTMIISGNDVCHIKQYMPYIS